ncbi:DUF3488 domain-containing protein [Leucobacter insecticola]|uniref:DUF3488 domain-containing protein n=1 Tax=Leucobacter insecticola TaxID=2714934 RepID=UPI001FCBACF6|nr:DUF3488 domain-containing protein [Leucobacter insecticola]
MNAARGTREPGTPAPFARMLGAGIAAAIALTIGVFAAWPIYVTPWLWVLAGAALVAGSLLAWARERWRLRWIITTALFLALLVLTIVPVAVPQSLQSGVLRGLLDGLAAVALGWKQLLTLSLPVGTYQTVLVPAYLVMLLTVVLTFVLAARPGRWASLAALPLLAPVAFGTVFGASAVSAPFRLGPVTITAPRELALWLAAGALGACWVTWTAGAQRRAALKLGRAESSAGSGGRFVRSLLAAATVVVALGAGALVAPALDAGTRAVPRDSVDPEIVVRDRPSPLASYRASKTDDAIDVPLFTVSSSGGLPQHLRLAVLDAYEGIDFHVSEDAAGRFSRFPSGEALSKPSTVTVEVAEGYQDIWAPSAILGAPPSFGGPRAAELADSFYVNRETGAAIAVPGGAADRSLGLREGDRYTAPMETRELSADLGTSGAALIDLETTPEMARWIERQGVAADGQGLVTLIERLRARGYLSHALDDSGGEPQWLQRLSEKYGTSFEASSGGHSLARIETLFSQLNTQQQAAGEDASDAVLVAGVGDDEQFATAAALLARALGFESRVVVGVRFGEGVAGVPGCEDVCTGENLSAWIEVQAESGSWVPIDVTRRPRNGRSDLSRANSFPSSPPPQKSVTHARLIPRSASGSNRTTRNPRRTPPAQAGCGRCCA